MRRFLPQTLFGQTLLVLLAGIGVSLGAGAWIYASAGQEAVRTVGALAAAERIVNVTRLVSEAPADWRKRLVDGVSDPMFRVALLTGRPALTPDAGAVDGSAAIAAYIREALPGRTVAAAVTFRSNDRPLDSGRPRGPGPHYGPGPGYGPAGSGGTGTGQMMQFPTMHGPMPHGPLSRAAMSWRGLDAAVELGEGQWLRFTTALPDTGPTLSPRLLLALAVMAGMVTLLTVWAARRMTAPLRVLSNAAMRLGRNVDAPALATISGSIETRRAAEAFNDMQARLRRLIENRTLMLAAISHDLRTQLTLLRLRSEAHEPGEERERMLRTIAEMEEMLTATLSFAREEAKTEERRPVDVGALLSSIVDDMADAGLPVETGAIDEASVIEGKSVALRRAITNLIDNAVKYGSKATVGLSSRPSGIEITVNDEGPGIPEDQLARVLQPFYRVEGSRSRDTGGIGLGLAITASIAEAHGGTLSLVNRSQGGLRATLQLPRQPDVPATGLRS